MEPQAAAPELSARSARDLPAVSAKPVDRSVGARQRKPRSRDQRALARLLESEASADVYPVLLEEVLRLGYPRALVLEVQTDTGDLTPAAALNYGDQSTQPLRSSAFQSDHAIRRILAAGRPRVLHDPALAAAALYCHPVRFCASQPCAAVVIVELGRNGRSRPVPELVGLIEFANRTRVRLLKEEQQRARIAALQRSVTQLDRLLHSVSDPIILTDTEQRVLLHNKAAERFFQYVEGQSEGRARAVQLNTMLFSAALSSMAVSGTGASRDLTLVDAIEGEEVLFEAVCTPTMADGNFSGVVAVLRDVTDLRRADDELRLNYERLARAEEVLRQDRDRLNVVFENVGDPIVVCDGSAKPVLRDPLAQRLFVGQGNTEQDALCLKNQAQFDAYLSAFTYSFAERQSGQLRLHDPASGKEVEYDVRSGKIYNERAQVEFTVTVLRDLSAFREMERLKLERRLLEVEKFAATGRLAATIAHEVNNPMEAVKNAIYLLSGAVRPEAQPVYDVLVSETERMARIVRQMLSLYRAKPRVEVFSLELLLREILQLFAYQLERARIQVRLDLRQLPQLLGNSDQIRQVLSNLIVNARDSMPGSGTLTLRTRHCPRPDSAQDRVVLVVADTGAGIPAPLLARVFEPFVTTKEERGTGLGLWITKNIIESHGGTIQLRSKLGRGTAFRITLPVRR
jgi:PAS domain S-box-containing protein